jgi:hypothetical protein
MTVSSHSTFNNSHLTFIPRSSFHQWQMLLDKLMVNGKWSMVNASKGGR